MCKVLKLYTKTKIFLFQLFLLQTAELSQWQRRVSDLNNKISELEDNLSKTQKEFIKAQEQCAKFQRDLRENVAQKEDQVKYLKFHFFLLLIIKICFLFVR